MAAPFDTLRHPSRVGRADPNATRAQQAVEDFADLFDVRDSAGRQLVIAARAAGGAGRTHPTANETLALEPSKREVRATPIEMYPPSRPRFRARDEPKTELGALRERQEQHGSDSQFHAPSYSFNRRKSLRVAIARGSGLVIRRRHRPRVTPSGRSNER